MLIAMRERISGWVAWVLVIIIGLAFSLFGLRYYLTGGNTSFAAKVDDAEISLSDLSRSYQNQRERMIQAMGEEFDPSQIDATLLRRSTLELLIDREVLTQAANKAGYFVEDSMVATQIQNTPAFHENGRFSSARYGRALDLQGRSKAGYEAQLRRAMLVDQFVDSVVNSEILMKKDINQIWQIQGQERELSYLILSRESFIDDKEITQQEYAAHHEKNADRYRQPEQIKLAYVELNADVLGADAEVTEEEMQQLYEENIEQYGRPEERRARHILINVSADADAAAIAVARSKSDDIVKRLGTGASFESLAKELSDDPGSKGQGGDLGFFSKGAMVPEFEATVFAQQVGDVSEPVKSAFGFHIIELTEIKPADAKALDEVRGEILAAEKHRRGLDRLYEDAEAFANLAFEFPDSLERISSEMDLSVSKTEWFYRTGGSGIASERLVIDAAFSDEVLIDGNNSEPLEIGDGRLVVVRMEEYKASQIRPLDEVKNQIKQSIQNERAKLVLLEQGEDLVARLREGESLAEVAADLKLSPVTPGFVTRAATAAKPEIIQKAFELPVPKASEPAYGGLELASGDYALLQVSELRQGDIGSLTKEQSRGVEQQYRRMYTDFTRKAVLAELKAQADIVYGSKAAE